MVYVFFILLLIGVVHGAEKTATAGNITTKVLGNSGKISVYPSNNETNNIVITFDAIHEIDTEGNQIKGQNKHSYQNFAQLDFTFTDVVMDNFTDSVHGDIEVYMFTFESDIVIDGNTATLKTYVYIFKEDANITVDGENVTVKEGDMKFNIEIMSWPFCGAGGVTCGNLVGEYLDFYISIKGQKPSNTTGSSVDLGNGKVIVPKSYEVDSTTTKDMPTGYPMETTQGSSNVFIFRFEKFATSVLYDPIVSMETGDGTDGDGGDSGGETAEAEVAASGVTAKVLGQSGKMRIMKGDYTITAEIDALQEKTAGGADVKAKDHSYNTMASQEFVLGNVEDVDYPNTQLGTQKVPAVATLNNNAKVMLDIYVFKEAGNITIGDETIMVSQGTVKFTVEVMSWTFCDASTCNNEVGELLDVDIKVKGKKSATKEAQSGSKSGQKYDVGDAYMTLSEMVTVDSNQPASMATGYPMLTTKGQTQIFRIRLPKFTNKVVYDPTFSFYGGTNAANQRLAFPAMLMAAILFLIKFTL